ncbi:MAG: sigma-70 family RNA polymerase sigma factor [Planctomycetota bacterium]
MSALPEKRSSRSLTASGRKPGAEEGERSGKPAELTYPELWRSYQENPGQDTRNRLVEQYHSFAREIVRRFCGRLPRTVDRGDLEVAGSVGLISAVEGFDPERGVRFESYCELRVKGALLDELRTQDWLPRPWRQRLEQRKRTTEFLRAELGREPDDEEVASSMEMDSDEYQRVFGIGVPMAPTGTMAFDDAGDEAMPVLEAVPDMGVELPGDRLSREDLLTLVAQKLSDQEYRIVYLKYWEDLTMREIGELTGLSESRVCKIHTRLMGRLRDRFADEDF